MFAVRAVDPDGDPIRFSLAPALFRDGSSYFRVDPITGEVFLSKSLKGMGANDLYINIRADDGHHQVKMEIGIKIVGANHGSPQERKDELDAAPSKPSISDIRQPASTGHDINLASLPQPNPSDDAKSFSDVQETSNHNVVILVLIGTIILIFTIVLSFFWRKWAGLEESAGSKEKVQSVSKRKTKFVKPLKELWALAVAGLHFLFK